MSCMLLQQVDARCCLFPPAPSSSASLPQCRCALCRRRHAIGASSPSTVPTTYDRRALLRRCSHDHDCPLPLRPLALLLLFPLSHLRLRLRYLGADGLTGFSSVIRSGVVLPPCPPLLSEISQRSPCVHFPSICLCNRFFEVTLTLPISTESDSIRGAHRLQHYHVNDDQCRHPEWGHTRPFIRSRNNPHAILRRPAVRLHPKKCYPPLQPPSHKLQPHCSCSLVQHRLHCSLPRLRPLRSHPCLYLLQAKQLVKQTPGRRLPRLEPRRRWRVEEAKPVSRLCRLGSRGPENDDSTQLLFRDC